MSVPLSWTLEDSPSLADLIPSSPAVDTSSGDGAAVLLAHEAFWKSREVTVGIELDDSPSNQVPPLLARREAKDLSGLIARGKVATALTPTHTQYITIYCIMVYFVVMLFGWNLTYLRSILFPFKLLTVGLHESCHAIMGTLTGAKVESIILDPNQGGATRMRGGWPFLSLPAGYIGSSTIGAALVFSGFDEKASKIACFPLLGFLVLLLWWGRKDWFTAVNILLPVGIIASLWIIQHAAFLRFFILFIGVMNCMYALWDVLDDLVFQKIEESDCCAFWHLYPWMPAQAWGAVWFSFAFSALMAGVIGALVLFKDNFEQQQAAGQTFIPT